MRDQKSITQLIDWPLIILYLILVIWGFFTIYAAIYSPTGSSLFDFDDRQGKQLMWIGAALIIAMMILMIDARLIELLSYFIYAATLGLLVAVLILGKEVAGSKSWFEIGSFKLQPAEFTKFATALALAKHLSGANKSFDSIKTRVIAVLIMIIPAGLVLLQNDTGSAIVYSVFILVLYREGLSGNILLLGVAVAMLFVLALIVNKVTLAISLSILAFFVFLFMKRKIKEVAFLVIGLMLAVSFIYSVDYVFENVLKEHQKTRITVLLGEEKKLQAQLEALDLKLSETPKKSKEYEEVRQSYRDKRQSLRDLKAGAGWNIRQSKIAIGSGGFLGKGYLQGTQTKFNFVPEQSTDFIFCTIGEEWGFLGSVVLIILYVSLFVRIVILSERQKTQFARIYGYGVASILFFHFAINIAMTIGLAPTIGIPLPFLSYGGSSLWAFTILLFIFIKLDAHRLLIL